MHRSIGKKKDIRGKPAESGNDGGSPARTGGRASSSGNRPGKKRSNLAAELEEALAQQAATADILSAIAKFRNDTGPVFKTIVDSALKLFPDAAITIAVPEGDYAVAAAQAIADPDYVEVFKTRFPVPLTREYLHGLAMLERRLVNVADAREVPDELKPGANAFLKTGYRAITVIPLVLNSEAIGALSISRRKPIALSMRQLAVLQTFAEQAVIAIENAQSVAELETRNAEIEEALKQQTATSDVLRLISLSTGNLDPVFETLLQKAIELCRAEYGIMFLRVDEEYRAAASFNVPPKFREHLSSGTRRLGKGTATGRAMLSGRPVHILDLDAEQADEDREIRRASVELGGARTIFAVPLMEENGAVGAITIYRKEVKAFSDKQIDLVSNFASQAVIAIRNARLLSELRETLEQQTVTANVLKTISSTAFDLEAVLSTLIEEAARFCRADQGMIAREESGRFIRIASYGFSEEFDDAISVLPVNDGRGTAAGRAVAEKRVVHIADIRDDPEYTFAPAAVLAGIRTILAVPMLRAESVIGVLILSRKTVQPFGDREIDLVSNFADQAAIAIGNVRLYEAAEARSRDLARSLQELQLAQDRLVQTEKLASLGQLTAGIAHEIKNPLNFVNNFAALSVELIAELADSLAASGPSNDEAGEIFDMLAGNLAKIEEHGKRADSIVRNMLMHARHGSGEMRTTDINALVDETLNLAFHGARAEQAGFNILMERSFDPAAGEAMIMPQEITRVLVNIISNGFYAATKARDQQGDKGFMPRLDVSTRNLGDRVEIRIRDNGIGMSAQVKERLFSPFFTTKPVGEGTGLGLSISHDIIVKQHSGSIGVETEPGEFCEFSIVLPRTPATTAKAPPS